MKYSLYYRKAFPCPPREEVGGGKRKRKLNQINSFGIQGDGISYNNPDKVNNQNHPLHPRQRGTIGNFHIFISRSQIFNSKISNDKIKISRLLTSDSGLY